MNDVQLVTMIHLFNDWHSGGGSRGYRLLCLALRAYARRYHPGQHGVHPLDIKLISEYRRLYRRLETAWMNAL